MFRYGYLSPLLVVALFASCGDEGEKSSEAGRRSFDQSTNFPSNSGNWQNPGNNNSITNFSTAAGKQQVTFQGSRGDKVPALLYHPGSSNKSPAVMVQYGITGDKSSSTIQQVADVLNQNGFIVLVIDVPGRGERTSPTGEIDPVQTVLNQDLFRWYVNDYGAAATYLASRPDVDVNKLAYIGASWGAITGIPFVARDQRLKALVSVVGGGGFFGVIPEDLDPARTIQQISPRPIMLINATQDQIILEPFWRALHNAAPSNAKKLLLETDHTLSGVDLDGLVTQIVSFLKDSLVL